MTSPIKANSNMYDETTPFIVFVCNKREFINIFEIEFANNVAENFDFNFRI